MALVARQ